MRCLAKRPEGNRSSEAKELNWNNHSLSPELTSTSEFTDGSETSKTKKRYLFFVITACFIVIAGALWLLLKSGKEHRDCIPVSGVSVGDSIIITSQVIPDTNIQLISATPKIVEIKGNIIKALKEGETVLTVSTKDRRMLSDIFVRVLKTNEASKETIQEIYYSQDSFQRQTVVLIDKGATKYITTSGALKEMKITPDNQQGELKSININQPNHVTQGKVENQTDLGKKGEKEVPPQRRYATITDLGKKGKKEVPLQRRYATITEDSVLTTKVEKESLKEKKITPDNQQDELNIS